MVNRTVEENEDVDKVLDLCYFAWTIIANVDGGDWLQSVEWNKAAYKFRDEFHAVLMPLIRKKNMEAPVC